MADARRARFVQEYVYGPHAGNAAQSYIAAGYAARGADGNAARLIVIDSIAAEIAAATAGRDATIKAEGIASKAERQRRYNDLAEAFDTIRAERAADPLLRTAAGASTGLVTRKVKLQPHPDPTQPPLRVSEDAIDTAAIASYLATLKQAAIESSQWAEKRELTGKDGGALTIQLLREMAARGRTAND